MKKNWQIKKYDAESVDSLSSTFNINRNIASILLSRNIKTTHEVNKFLNPSFSDLHSPFEMNGMYDAVEKIRHAIAAGSKIGIFADSDLDGLTSLTILNKLFNRLNIEVYYRYIKNNESYGISHEIIDEFKDNNVDIIITVDSGIRDVDEIAYAGELGIEVIITDHHEQGEVLPDAIIINPKMINCNYPFKDLAGVGVTFKFCMAILYSFLPIFNKYFYIATEIDQKIILLKFINNVIEERCTFDDEIEFFNTSETFDENTILIFYKSDNLYEKFQQLNRFKLYNLFDFIIPYHKNFSAGENISEEKLMEYFNIDESFYENKVEFIEKIFLEVQHKSSDKILNFINSILGFVSIGSIADIMPLVDENRVLVRKGIDNLKNTGHTGLSILMNNTAVTSKEISWGIAPLLNTPGRFGKTELTADFFLTKDWNLLNSTISKIKELNEKRKVMSKELFDDILDEIKEGNADIDQDILLIKSEKIHDGLAGLLANKISEAKNKPAIIISLNSENDFAKGSGRCSSKFDFFSYISQYSELFERIGGHAQAFGFTINADNIDKLIIKLKESDPIFYPEKMYTIDLELPLNQVTREFISELDVLEPFGEGNEEPVFLTKSIPIESFAKFGSEKNHGRYKLKSNPPVTAIGWNMSNIMEEYILIDDSIDLIYTLENNYYNGIYYPRMIILDINSSSKLKVESKET